MREEILRVLKNENQSSLTKTDLKNRLSEKRGFEKEFARLEEEGVIFTNKKNKVCLSEDYNYLVAEIIKAGVQELLAQVGKDEEKRLFKIPSFASLGALYKDIVLISIDYHQAAVIKIIKPYDGNIVGEIVKGRHSTFVRPLDQNFPLIDIAQDKLKNAQEGHRVVVKISSRLPILKGEVIEILGHKNDPKVDILSLAYQANVPVFFNKEIMEEVEINVPSEVKEEDKVGRKDLTKELIVTIDGLDAKDLDDAIEVKKQEDGNYYLGVHIADVSHYVEKYSIIDKEAFKRGTSIYLTDYVIPMLPHALSNGICSLNPNVERLAFSCSMIIDKEGEIIDYDIYESVIKSKHRLNYDDVNAFYKGKHEYPDDLGKMLNDALELSHILRKYREKRGALDLDVQEGKIIVDGNGKPKDVVLRSRDEGEMLIEDFMISANETVASHIYWQNLPFVYRVHDKPKQSKFNDFCHLIAPLGYRVKGERNGVHPLEIQSLLKRVKGTPVQEIISNLLLRSLAKAVYQSENIGHFGLASDCYTHFTSPIRRYPDLMVHRLLRLYSKSRPKKIDELGEEIEYQAQMASMCERRAIDLERKVDDMKKAEYMQEHIGEQYEGKISGMISTGMFVSLPNTIEGFIKFDDMEDDYYSFDSDRMVVIGDGTKRIFKLGDKVLVEVKAANKEIRKVDFYLIKRL